MKYAIVTLLVSSLVFPLLGAAENINTTNQTQHNASRADFIPMERLNARPGPRKPGSKTKPYNLIRKIIDKLDSKDTVHKQN